MIANRASGFSACFVVSFLEETGIGREERRAALQAAAISPDLLDQASSPAAGMTISEEQFSELFKYLAYQLEDELPGLLSKPLRCGAMKYAALSVITAPTLAVALRRHARYLNLVIHDFEVVFEPGDTWSTIVFTETEATGSMKTMAFALMLKMFHGLASWLVGRELPLERTCFCFAPPPYADDLQRLFPGSVYFGALRNELVIPSNLLDLTVLRSPMDLRGFLERQPRDWISASVATQPLAQQIRQFLTQADLATISLEDASLHLGVSTRSMSRRLKDEETSFQQIKDGLRFDLAVIRLTQTNAPLAEIAEELGFSDASSFHRAFRAWSGVAPGAYRQHRQSQRGRLPAQRGPRGSLNIEGRP